MSAFQVSEAHVSAIVTFGVVAGLVSDVNAAGEMLTAENHRSIVARYKDAGDAPSFRFIAEPKTAVEIVKLCNCFDYQACESSDYESTPAAAFVASIRKAALGGYVGETRRMPGYEEAAWSI